MKKSYFMYGLYVAYDKCKQWESDRHKNFPIGVYGDIFCFSEGRDCKYMIVGKKIAVENTKSPISVPELTELEENEVKYSILNKFGFEGNFQLYFIID